MRRALLFLPLAALMAGCSSGPKFAPVSGRITMKDGSPLPNVIVSFQPIETKGNENPGPGSSGVTDADGRYSLSISSQQYVGVGAVPGKHKVRIGSILSGEGKNVTDAEVGSPDGAPLEGHEIIPTMYNQNTKLEFTVPPEGTDKADFQLELVKGKKEAKKK